jgi:hypothetical protein
MKLIGVVLLVLFPLFALAKDDGFPRSISGKKISTNQSKITWEEFKGDVLEVCQGIKSKGHYIQKDACVFWSQEKGGDWICLIFTRENIADEVFAKIIKRCYQGN